MADPKTTLPECPRPGCRGSTARVRWQVIAGGRKHLRCECGTCGRWLKYLPQTAYFSSLADQEEAERARPSGWVTCPCGEQSFIPENPPFLPIPCAFCGSVLVPAPAGRLS